MFAHFFFSQNLFDCFFSLFRFWIHCLGEGEGERDIASQGLEISVHSSDMLSYRGPF